MLKSGLRSRISVLAAGAIFVMAAALADTVRAAESGLASALHRLQVERGKLCMASHFHHGFGTGRATKHEAFVEAMKGWQNFTRLEYGSDWASIRMATEKTRDCSKGLTGWKCHVKARPCRSR